MNEIVNMLLLREVNFMPEMLLRQPEITYSTRRPLAKTMKEYKSLKKQEIHDIFIKTN